MWLYEQADEVFIRWSWKDCRTRTGHLQYGIETVIILDSEGKDQREISKAKFGGKHLKKSQNSKALNKYLKGIFASTAVLD